MDRQGAKTLKPEKDRMTRSLSDFFRDTMDPSAFFRYQEEPATSTGLQATRSRKTSKSSLKSGSNMKVAFSIPETKVDSLSGFVTKHILNCNIYV